MCAIEAIGREVKKIYREHQFEFVLNSFRNQKQELINDAFNEKSMNSLKILRLRQLKDFESE